MRTKIAADGGEDGDSFGPGHNTNIRAKSAISGDQGGAQEAAVRHRPAVPRPEMWERVVSRQWLGSYSGQFCWGRRLFPHLLGCGWPVERHSATARTGYSICSTSHGVLRCAMGAEGDTVTITTTAASENQSCLPAIALVDSTLKGCSAPQTGPR